MTAEEWRDAVGYEGLYEVSNLGRIRSWIPYNRRSLPVMLSPYLSANGYYYQRLRRSDGKYTNPTLHKLLMAAFVGPRPAGMVVRHLDGDRANCSLSNMRYGTPSENNDDAVTHGTHSEARREACERGHEYTLANTKIEPRPGGRQARRCRACLQRYQDEAKARRAARRAA